MEQITDCTPCSGGACSDAHSDWAGRCLASIDTGHSLISGPPDFVGGFKDRVTPEDGACARSHTVGPLSPRSPSHGLLRGETRLA